ncbi:hypothetical protein Huta_0963 [Halorhabdus utahensis DSM 12940]|uniref:Uncharacterized protein n=2 Tax=Halorhabdus utahensis TaxID=146826 RepID=C7NUY3_HALUD|nr:hypothetical protein Huta_0963 [Halorhabdus utahensis DSM 12940]
MQMTTDVNGTKGVLTGLIGLVGTVVFLGLFVYPLQYGLKESAAVAGLIVLAGLWEFVLDSAELG